MPQDNDQLVASFKMLLAQAHFDTQNEMLHGTEHVRINRIGGYQISDKRLGQVLRAIKATND